MDSIARRLIRRARSRLAELTAEMHASLEMTAELADDLGREDVASWCQGALDLLLDTLSPDCWPTAETESLLPVLAQGIRDALRQLRPASDDAVSTAVLA